jgi:hypothetical protein
MKLFALFPLDHSCDLLGPEVLLLLKLLRRLSAEKIENALRE